MSKSKNITKPTRKKVHEYPCRVYSSQKGGPVTTDRQANLRSTEKLALALGSDIVSGDELMVTCKGFIRG